MGISVQLAIEIRTLLESGYTEEEIIEMINNIDFSKLEEKYDSYEQSIIKVDAIETLKIMKKRRD